jgi:hypothetical protein
LNFAPHGFVHAAATRAESHNSAAATNDLARLLSQQRTHGSSNADAVGFAVVVVSTSIASAILPQLDYGLDFNASFTSARSNAASHVGRSVNGAVWPSCDWQDC